MPAGMGQGRRGARLAETLAAPAWALILLVFALPVIAALWLSFRNETLGGFVAPRFIGFDNYRAALTDPLPEEIRARHRLMTLAAAIEEAHWPHEFDQRDAALRRLAFDELLAVQLSLVRRRRRRARGSAPCCAGATGDAGDDPAAFSEPYI